MVATLGKEKPWVGDSDYYMIRWKDIVSVMAFCLGDGFVGTQIIKNNNYIKVDHSWTSKDK